MALPQAKHGPDTLNRCGTVGAGCLGGEGGNWNVVIPAGVAA